MTAATHLDLYQLTSLVTHAAAGRLNDPVVMSFFSRKMPEDPVTGEPRRGALIFAGLTRIVAWLSEARFDEQAIAGLLAHPMLGPALATQPALVGDRRDTLALPDDVPALADGTASRARGAGVARRLR